MQRKHLCDIEYMWYSRWLYRQSGEKTRWKCLHKTPILSPQNTIGFERLLWMHSNESNASKHYGVAFVYFFQWREFQNKRAEYYVLEWIRLRKNINKMTWIWNIECFICPADAMLSIFNNNICHIKINRRKRDNTESITSPFSLWKKCYLFNLNSVKFFLSYYQDWIGSKYIERSH